jgi:hypothetical protein
MNDGQKYCKRTVTAYCPIPDSATFCGLFTALSTIFNFPLRLPLARGLKVSEIVQVPPAANEPGQLLV